MIIVDVFVDATDTVFRSVDLKVRWKPLCHCWNGSVHEIYLALFLTHYNVFVILINPQHIFSHGTGTLRCLQKEMATYRHWYVSLWRDPDNVPHCRILSPDKTEWRLILATLCGWRRCFVADQLWFMTRIREEEEEEEEEAVKRTFEVLTL